MRSKEQDSNSRLAKAIKTYLRWVNRTVALEYLGGEYHPLGEGERVFRVDTMRDLASSIGKEARNVAEENHIEGGAK